LFLQPNDNKGLDEQGVAKGSHSKQLNSKRSLPEQRLVVGGRLGWKCLLGLGLGKLGRKD